MVFSASFYYSADRWGDGLYFFKRQCLWAVVGFAGMFIASRFDYTRLQKFSRIFLLISIALLVLVLFIGEERNNAKRWLGIGSFSIQPAEIAKFAMILFISDTIARSKGGIRKFLGRSSYSAGNRPGICAYNGTARLQYSRQHCYAGLYYALCRRSQAVAPILIDGSRSCRSGINPVCRLPVDRLTAFLDPWSDPKDSGCS